MDEIEHRRRPVLGGGLIAEKVSSSSDRSIKEMGERIFVASATAELADFMAVLQSERGNECLRLERLDSRGDVASAGGTWESMP